MLRMFAVCSSALLFWATVECSGQATDRIALRVLYAGNIGSDRAKDFVNFLQRHFVKVGTGALASFRPAAARDFDVIIFDWTSIYSKTKDGELRSDSGISMPPVPMLDQTYDRPTILIGAVGGQVSRPLQLKLDWL